MLKEYNVTLKRDLAWKHLDLVNRSSVTYQYARYGLGLTYESLPEEVGCDLASYLGYSQ